MSDQSAVGEIRVVWHVGEEMHTHCPCAKLQGQYKQAAAYFHDAMTSAARAGDKPSADLARVMIGVSRGASAMGDHMQQVAAALSASSTQKPTGSSSSS